MIQSWIPCDAIQIRAGWWVGAHNLTSGIILGIMGMPEIFVSSPAPAARWARNRQGRALAAVAFALAGVLAIWHSAGAPVSLDSSNLRGESSVSAYQRAGYGMDSKTSVEDSEDIMSSIRNLAHPPRAPPAPAAPSDIPANIMAAFLGQRGGQASSRPARATQAVAARSTPPVGQSGGGDALSAQQEQNKAMFEAALRGQEEAHGDHAEGKEKAAAPSAEVAGDGESVEVRALKDQVHALASEVAALRTPQGRQRRERHQDGAPRQARQAGYGGGGAGGGGGAPLRWRGGVAGEAARRETPATHGEAAASPRGGAARDAGAVSSLAGSCVAPGCTCVPDGTSEKVAIAGTFSLTSMDGEGPQKECRFFNVEGPTGHRLSLLLQEHDRHWTEYGAVATGCISRAALSKPGSTLVATDLMTGSSAAFGLACPL